MKAVSEKYGIKTTKWKEHKLSLSKIKEHLDPNEQAFIDEVLSIDKGIGMNTFATFISLYDKANFKHLEAKTS